MLRINQLKLPVGHTKEELKEKVQKLLRTKDEPEITVIRRSVDARKKPELYFNYILNVTVKNQKEVYKRCNKKLVIPWEETEYRFPVSCYTGEKRPIIIGTGPAGLFCGYLLAQAGFRPILLERGKEIKERTRDVSLFWETGALNPESNVQFGEGGAGTFSDGKLNTLVKDKSGRNKKVLSIFVKEGAPEEILYDFKPHIGTDVLSNVIINIRKQIIRMGGEVRFQSKVTGFETENQKVRAVIVNNKERLPADYVVLAVGHSARDTFYTLYEMGLPMNAKSFAVGLRVEHPQKLINLSQYGHEEENNLGSAPYKLTAAASDKRGVYSFCMCPGGFVVNAASEQGRLAVNGMSYSGRDGKNANSAIIVSVTPEDFESTHPLAGIEFQRKLEEKAYEIGQGAIPIETYGDFRTAILNKEDNGSGKKQEEDRKPDLEARKQPMPEETEEKYQEIFHDFEPCIKGKWKQAPVHEILPGELSKAFVEGMEQFGAVIPGFNHENTLIDGVESRTSSPVRIERDETLQTTVRGIFPCGEGAGYAGGITSAAMDGIKVAEEIASQIINESCK